jgi:hypothetical protein
MTDDEIERALGHLLPQARAILVKGEFSSAAWAALRAAGIAITVAMPEASDAETSNVLLQTLVAFAEEEPAIGAEFFALLLDLGQVEQSRQTRAATARDAAASLAQVVRAFTAGRTSDGG